MERQSAAGTISSFSNLCQINLIGKQALRGRMRMGPVQCLPGYYHVNHKSDTALLLIQCNNTIIMQPMVIEERERERRVFLVETNISLNCKFGQFKHFGRFRPATNLLLMDDVLWPPLLATATTYRRTLCSFPPLRNVFDGTCLRLNRLKHKKLQCYVGIDADLLLQSY